ncbi:MAG: nickel ABC transporter permease subunit NikC, partial [Intestinibacter sp.]|nr:nickel ABC transporter permease subunit NikC [Intestinibacter sp.]
LNCPWLMVFPGLAICIVVIIFNLIGDNLRDILDVRQETSESKAS